MKPKQKEDKDLLNITKKFGNKHHNVMTTSSKTRKQKTQRIKKKNEEAGKERDL